ncbi:unnamed protein product [Pleuronectes platessa]|uniref:Uncharacterized protein n=1 Tax=Pleuronectes platessa TaxID=8262 RepID=A0A9N7VW30_PLEPL|nr:unnamed protein product [Pleuronectes platessa]
MSQPHTSSSSRCLTDTEVGQAAVMVQLYLLHQHNLPTSSPAPRYAPHIPLFLLLHFSRISSRSPPLSSSVFPLLLRPPSCLSSSIIPLLLHHPSPPPSSSPPSSLSSSILTLHPPSPPSSLSSSIRPLLLPISSSFSILPSPPPSSLSSSPLLLHPPSSILPLLLPSPPPSPLSSSILPLLLHPPSPPHLSSSILPLLLISPPHLSSSILPSSPRCWRLTTPPPRFLPVLWANEESDAGVRGGGPVNNLLVTGIKPSTLWFVDGPLANPSVLAHGAGAKGELIKERNWSTTPRGWEGREGGSDEEEREEEEEGGQKPREEGCMESVAPGVETHIVPHRDGQSK